MHFQPLFVQHFSSQYGYVIQFSNVNPLQHWPLLHNATLLQGNSAVISQWRDDTTISRYSLISYIWFQYVDLTRYFWCKYVDLTRLYHIYGTTTTLNNSCTYGLTFRFYQKKKPDEMYRWWDVPVPDAHHSSRWWVMSCFDDTWPNNFRLITYFDPICALRYYDPHYALRFLRRWNTVARVFATISALILKLCGRAT
jgi:hypothetical protein